MKLLKKYNKGNVKHIWMDVWIYGCANYHQFHFGRGITRNYDSLELRLPSPYALIN